jgi:RNA polymerase-interacting CarD/CdnL/TRCF family regulator
MDGIFKVLQELTDLTPTEWKAFKRAYSRALKSSSLETLDKNLTRLDKVIVTSGEIRKGQDILTKVI